MVNEALHEHGPAQAAKDDRLTREGTSTNRNGRKILDTTKGEAMNREDLDWFLSEFGYPSAHQKVGSGDIEKYRCKLPDALLSFWERFGFCGFQDGLFWVVNPSCYEDILREWISDTDLVREDNYYVIARNAFGDLYLWGEKTGGKYKIVPRYGWILPRPDDRYLIEKGEADDALSSFFGDREPQDMDTKDRNGRPLFKQALRKLGPLDVDEVFGFKPALIVSNQALLENINRVNIFAHLSFLAQLGERTVMTADALANAAG